MKAFIASLLFYATLAGVSASAAPLHTGDPRVVHSPFQNYAAGTIGAMAFLYLGIMAVIEVVTLIKRLRRARALAKPHASLPSQLQEPPAAPPRLRVIQGGIRL
jgi:hypothetical protein